MGCFDSGGSESRTIVQSSDLPEYVKKGGEENYEKAVEISERPYEAYTQPRIAGFICESMVLPPMMRIRFSSWPSVVSALRCAAAISS